MKYFTRRSHYWAFILIIFLASAKKSFSQQYTQEFSRFGKISFPFKPHDRSNKIDTVYSVKYRSAAYGLAIHSFRHDPTFTLDSGHLHELYNGFLRQLSAKSNITLIYKNPIVISGLDGIDFKYKDKVRDTIYTCYHRILYVNRTMYNYGFTIRNDSDKIITDIKKDFLNSFVITEKKENLYQFYEISDDDNSFSAKLADLVVDCLFIVLGIVVIYFIMKGLIYLFKAVFY